MAEGRRRILDVLVVLVVLFMDVDVTIRHAIEERTLVTMHLLHQEGIGEVYMLSLFLTMRNIGIV